VNILLCSTVAKLSLSVANLNVRPDVTDLLRPSSDGFDLLGLHALISFTTSLLPGTSSVCRRLVTVVFWFLAAKPIEMLERLIWKLAQINHKLQCFFMEQNTFALYKKIVLYELFHIL